LAWKKVLVEVKNKLKVLSYADTLTGTSKLGMASKGAYVIRVGDLRKYFTDKNDVSWTKKVFWQMSLNEITSQK
jgi:hypothetical protein